MSRTLPPRPDFTQLKHQAKDLLRAHERKDAAACDVLRRLRRFATAGDARIFAAPLALHEAQYALAMEYGFASWSAMKRHVEKVIGRPSPVRRENGRTYVTGLEKHPIGHDGEHENSHIAAMAGVMAAYGEDELTYEYIMGASGAAFRVQMIEPAWCPSAACAGPGYNCIPAAEAVTGYRFTWIDTQREGREWVSEGVKQALHAAAASIDRGVPVIQLGKETSLLVGYGDNGRVIIRPYECGEDGYREIEVYAPDGEIKWVFGDGKWDDWVWAVGVVEPHDLPAERHQTIVNSLHLAVKLAHTERFGRYLSGFAALQYWIEGLLDESRFAGLSESNWWPIAHANGYCYGCLWSCRVTAEKYLREVAGEFDERFRGKLIEVADLYGREHRGLRARPPAYDCAWSLQPWRIGGADKWTPQMRRAEAEALREALAVERQAVAKIEAILPMLEAAVAEGGRA